MADPAGIEVVQSFVLRRFLRIFAASLVIGCAIGAAFFFRYGRGGSILAGLACALALVVIDRAPLSHRARATMFVTFEGLAMLGATLTWGLDIGPVLFALVLPFLAVLFLGPAAAVVSMVWCALTFAVAGVLQVRGVIVIPPHPTAVRMAPQFWPLLILAEVFVTGPIVYIANVLLSRLDVALRDQQRSLSELRKAHETLAASERLKTLGLLAGGMAHDLNNTLTVIAGETELAEGLTRQERETILQAASSAGQLTRQMLLSVGGVVTQPRVIDLSRELRPWFSAIARLMPETINVHAPKVVTSLLVKADPVLLQQALLNLAVNARDAMPRGGELFLTIEGGQRWGRPFAKLDVRDTGRGMDAATLARATEPFFTTKERGRGTGLGLSNVRTAVEGMGGELVLASEVGAGTCATLWLPLTEGEPESESLHEVARGEHRRVLLVEDNLHVRALAFEILQREGYQVTEAGTISRALEVLDGGLSADVIVGDLVLPDGSGLELAREVRRRSPRAGVVITSGYAAAVEEREALSKNEFRYLPKPFGAMALLRAVADAVVPVAKSA